MFQFAKTEVCKSFFSEISSSSLKNDYLMNYKSSFS